MTSPWILQSALKDFSFFYLPALISLALALVFPVWSSASLFYIFLATALIDSGHVYTTFWRWGDKALKKIYYPLILVTVFVIVSAAYYGGARQVLWSGIVYLTVFHHIRQVYGFSRWYQRLNERYCSMSSFKLYLLALIPFIAFHFRDLHLSYYSDADLLMYPNPRFFAWTIKLYLVIVLGSLLHEWYLWKCKIRELNRALYLFLVSMTYGYSFLIGKTLSQVLFPLLFIHGVAYLAVMSHHLTQHQRSNRKWVFLWVTLTALFFGSAESIFEDHMDQVMNGTGELLNAFLIGAYLTPLLSHYIFDAFLWRRRAATPLANK